MNNDIVFRLATFVRQQGGSTYYVGGCVRDHFLGIPNKDIDVEVHGISEEMLKAILTKIGEPLEYGKEFGVYSIKDTNIEISLPREEIKIGEGHKDFKVNINPNIGTERAAIRRDFTINALMVDAITNELIDHYGGMKDLSKRVIRHIDDKTFVEDPLRVFRAAQLAARINFKIDEGTVKLCKTMRVSHLSKQRVEEELKKALLNSNKPSAFFNVLKNMNQLNYWFDEVKRCIGWEQNPKKHPEGDVYEHTMLALDEAVLYRDAVSNPYNFMLLVLVHDFGKLKTRLMTDEGWHFYGHEKHLNDIIIFLDRLVSNNETKDYILQMVPRHMQGHKIFKDKYSEYESNKWFDGVRYPKDLVFLTVVDKANHRDPDRLTFLMHRYSIYQAAINGPHVTGQDLIDLGFTPSENFTEYLAYSRDLALRGVKKSKALSLMSDYIVKGRKI